MTAPVETLGGGTGAKVKQGHHTAKFTGTDNPRHLRAIAGLMRRPMPREALDREASCSNSPDLVANLRRLGLEIPCTRIEALDKDGLPCRPGVYYLTYKDRLKIKRWLRERSHE